MGRINYVHVDHLLTRATVAPDSPTVPPDTPTVAPDSVERHPGLVKSAPRMPLPHRSLSLYAQNQTIHSPSLTIMLMNDPRPLHLLNLSNLTPP